MLTKRYNFFHEQKQPILYQNPMENNSSSTVREFKWFLAQHSQTDSEPLCYPISSYIIGIEGSDTY